MTRPSEQHSFEKRAALIEEAGAKGISRFVPVEMPSMEVAMRLVAGVVAGAGKAERRRPAPGTAGQKKRAR